MPAPEKPCCAPSNFNCNSERYHALTADLYACTVLFPNNGIHAPQRLLEPAARWSGALVPFLGSLCADERGSDILRGHELAAQSTRY